MGYFDADYETPITIKREEIAEIFQNLDSIILVQNVESTHGKDISKKFTPILSSISSILGITFDTVNTDENPNITAERIIDTVDKIKPDKAKEIGRVAVFFATGDGEVGKNIGTLRELGAFVCVLNAGGEANIHRSLMSPFRS